jgi:sialic acid synthase SpsE
MKIQEIFANHNQYGNRITDPYVIAEVGVNHEGDFDLAKRLIEEASGAGADAVKFQTYKAETLASRHSPAYWDTTKEATKSQFELFKKYDKFWKKEYEQLKVICDDNNVDFMSTPFDAESAHFLNDLMDIYKIASADITNKPLIEQVASYNKPILLSTGASNLDEIRRAMAWIGNKHDNKLALLHCILNYPTENANANLGMIKGLQQKFPNNVIGYSDHTLPGEMHVLEMATLLGASILEKHFTHDKTLPGNDHYHAMDKQDLRVFRNRMQAIHGLMGSYEKYAIPSEDPAREHARRSLVAATDIPAGTILAYEHMISKRPAHGISPASIDEVVGKRVPRSIGKDDFIVLE